MQSALERSLGSRHMPILDGLRGLAALCVVFYHFDEHRFPIGGLGVLTFFVLSGFLITWLLCAEADRSGTISLPRFYARRSLRIFPAFYVYWAITSGLLLMSQLRGGRSFPLGPALSSFFYVCNYYQGLNHYPSSGYSHTWSLGVEEQFYLVWPALFLAIVGLAARGRVRAVIAIVAAFWTVRLSLFFFGVREEYIYTSFETRADQLLVGCLLAVLLRAGMLKGSWLSSPKLILVSLAGLVASTYGYVVYGTSYRNSIGFCLEPILVSLLIVQLMSAHEHPLVRWLDSRPLKFLGAVSYSIYLYQQLVLHFVPRLVPASLPFVIRLPISVAAVVLAAWASYRLVEQPLNRYKARFAA